LRNGPVAFRLELQLARDGDVAHGSRARRRGTARVIPANQRG
jgi:hypothetical protein